ncbi:Vacuolar protein sorting-associated protein 41, partial [Podochytrium sp. JEL0797]
MAFDDSTTIPSDSDSEVEITSSEDSASSDEDEDDDEEPMLKYQRLSGTLAETLQKDAVSCLAVSDRFLVCEEHSPSVPLVPSLLNLPKALGTHCGMVHLLDLSGNNVKRFEAHSASVTDISIDSSAEFVASSSDDGRVVINSLYTPESIPYKHKRPIKCVALEPEYSRKPSRNHVSGGTGEELVMTGKGWFSSVDTVIGSGEGAVWAVEWRKDYIAWANDAGVKIYDTSTSQKFAYVDRPVGSPRADLYRCNLCWKDDTTLMIGWADSVKICVIKERAKSDTTITPALPIPGTALPSKYVEIICEFRTDFIISGIAPLRGQIALLSFITNEDPHTVDTLPSPDSTTTFSKKLVSNPPEVHVVDMNGDHIANDVLSLFGYEHYRANDYRLAFLPSATTPTDTTFYIVSPKDIVVARPRDLDDHIEFLVSRARYEEALAAVESATVTKKEADGSVYQGRMSVVDVVAIGLKYLESLMDDGSYDQAAQMTPKILRTDTSLWQKWIYTFLGVQKLSLLLPHIPITSLTLPKTVHEMMLAQFLESDPATFLILIQTWPPTLYDIPTVADAVESALASLSPTTPLTPPQKSLLESAILLSQRANRFDRALIHGLHLHDPTILDLVSPHNLFQTLQSNAGLLMSYDLATAAAEEDEIGTRTWTGRGEGFGDVLTGDRKEMVEEDVRIIRRQGLQRGVQLLVRNTDRAPVMSVVKELESVSRRFLHVYLDALFRFDDHEGVQYHTLQVELYADFDPTRLIDFLRSSAMYKIQTAYELCEVRDLVPEMVFLLGKMGNNRKALVLVIERLGDVKQ